MPSLKKAHRLAAINGQVPTRGRSLGVCVIGAGNGGIAMAGHLALKGLRVWLYSRSADKLSALGLERAIQLTGAVEGIGRLAGITTDLATAVAESGVVMVTTPASAHADTAAELATCLGHQVVVLNPGRTGGALEVHHILQQAGLDNTVVEAQTFIYASRAETPARAHIYDVKRLVPVAALPARRTRDVIRLLRRVYPEFMPATNVLETSFANIGAIFHPAPLILNAAKVESGLPFDYYHEGITPPVAVLMEHLDAERTQVAAALGIDAMPAREWLARAYGARGATLYDAIRHNTSYTGIKAPQTLQHRYISEDVPTGLVPIASFGRLLGVPTPYCDSLILMACGLHQVDYATAGRTVEQLGLAGMTPVEITAYVTTGHRAQRRRVRMAAGPHRYVAAGEPDVGGALPARWIQGAHTSEFLP